jgi:hypothetical protein
MKRFYARGYWGLVALLVLGAGAPCIWADVNYSSVILADAPIGYWRLGEDGTSPTAADSSGFGTTPRNGFYTRGVTSGVTGAIIGDTDTAASFDGLTSFIVLPNTTGGLFDLRNGFTLEAWIINGGQSGIGQAGRIFSNRGQGYGLGILFVGTPDRVRFTTFGVLDYDSNLTVVPQDGNWHHLVLVLDATNGASFYLDGLLTDFIQGSARAASSAADLNIGRNPGTTSEYFTGSIDEAAIYNYELTADQVLAHFMAAQPAP